MSAGIEDGISLIRPKHLISKTERDIPLPAEKLEEVFYDDEYLKKVFDDVSLWLIVMESRKSDMLRKAEHVKRNNFGPLYSF